MPLLGAHMSIAGGCDKAVRAAAALDMDCVQIFTKNNNQWRAKPLTTDDAERFRQALEETGVARPCAHASYLINLASPREELWRKSRDAFIVELERAELLDLEGVVVHPGSCGDSSEREGLERIAEALDTIHERTDGMSTEIWLETTAGQGTSLGHRFEHLQSILENVAAEDRLGVCIDTCHIFAAGYPLETAEEYAATMEEFDRLIGLTRVRAFHLNDSKRAPGSRVDRHEHIGEGYLGLEPFRHLVNDARFAEVPMYLETPKSRRDGESMDAVNLEKLRHLQQTPSR